MTRYRLSSGNNETSSSEDEYYDRKEAKVYGRNKAKETEKAAASKKATAKGWRWWNLFSVCYVKYMHTKREKRVSNLVIICIKSAWELHVTREEEEEKKRV